MVTGFCLCVSAQTPIFCLAGGRGGTVHVIRFVSGGKDLGLTYTEKDMLIYDNYLRVKMQFCKTSAQLMYQAVSEMQSMHSMRQVFQGSDKTHVDQYTDHWAQGPEGFCRAIHQRQHWQLSTSFLLAIDQRELKHHTKCFQKALPFGVLTLKRQAVSHAT